MAQSELVLSSVDNHVALITVSDPDRRNALTDEMSERLRAAVERAEADPEVHAVVVTGAGKAFCAGADLSALGAAGGGAAESALQRIYDGFMAVGNCRLPTIAAVNGAAVGAGLNLALAADVRIAGPAALFDARFQKLGLHPGGGATWMLQRMPNSLSGLGWRSALPTTPSPRPSSWPRGGRPLCARWCSRPRPPCARGSARGRWTTSNTNSPCARNSGLRLAPSNHRSSQADWPRGDASSCLR
jgi:Enoyl-CoA hydratase/isomerase